VRVLIVDDQTLVRAGFRKILETEPAVTEVIEAGNGAEALVEAARRSPDVVVMDIRMPEMDGLEATRRLVASDPTARVLILTTFNLDGYVYEALRAGASGFMLKDAPPEQLRDAVRLIAAGDALLSPAVTRAVITEFARGPGARMELAAALDQLTAREREVLDLVAQGLSNDEIAGRLVVSRATVKSHVASLLLKLGCRDRVQLVIFAYESGAARPGEDAQVGGAQPGR
jgi:RNA polymerase sigma factor (sigma-70 family)